VDLVATIHLFLGIAILYDEKPTSRIGLAAYLQ